MSLSTNTANTNINSPNIATVKNTVNNSKAITVDDSTTETNHLSQTGLKLNALYNQTLAVAKENPSPIYLTVEKRTELLEKQVLGIANKSTTPFTPEQIQTVTEDLKNSLNIKPIPRGDVNASSGNVYTFLNESDRVKISEAYQYALDNETSTDDVRSAAFNLAYSRFVEAKVNSGTEYVFLTSSINAAEQNSSETEPTSNATENEDNASKADHNGRSFRERLLSQLQNGGLFKSNPILQDSLFQETSLFLLTKNPPSFLEGKISFSSASFSSIKNEANP